MKISLVRTGGVAGMRRAMMIDTSDLDAGSARELERLVAAADLERIPEPTLSVQGHRDCFRYTLTVERGTRRHSVTFDEHRVPESLQPLVEAVWRRGSSGPGTVTA